jgi:hypothetical protein
VGASEVKVEIAYSPKSQAENWHGALSTTICKAKLSQRPPDSRAGDVELTNLSEEGTLEIWNCFILPQ